MAAGGEDREAEADGASPAVGSSSSQGPNMPGRLEPRADPDAQMTVSDFLDFTEYLPSDVIRSLTLIGKLDQTYTDASIKVHDLTTAWSQLPSYAVHERPDPARLRAVISEQLDQAVSSRVFAHAEAVRMSENVSRHYTKAKTLLEKLQGMMENYQTDEPKSPVAAKSPQMSRARLTVRSTDEDGKISCHRIPRITVPGEVLAPYDIEYDTCTDDSDISSDSESDMPEAGRRTPAPGTRIKLVANKTPKSVSRPPRPQHSSAAMTAATAANAAALLNPPPENAAVGSPDAPWLQLTQYELAKLRKRMKKNATWTPSDTMVARELKALGRGPDEYREAKRRAEEEGQAFNPTMPSPVLDDESGTQQLPAGALSADSLAAEEHPTSNRGMKLNEAKKLKREALAKLAAEEVEESARKMAQAAKLFMGNGPAKASEGSKEAPSAKHRTSSRSKGKRKREVDADNAEPAEASETPAYPSTKRTKTETPVPPPPQHIGPGQGNADGTGAPPNQGGSAMATQSETPVPIPVPPQSSSAKSGTSPSSVASNGNTITTSVPTKPPAAETAVPLPRADQKAAGPPLTREGTKRETRGDAAKRSQQQVSASSQPTQPAVPEQMPIRQSASRGHTPAPSEPVGGRRPGSRGKAMSQEPPPSFAMERSRRASTARNTPVPESKPPPKRAKRPAPGVVSTTSSGGNSAVGKRKAAPKRKARTTKREKGQTTETEMEEVDDEGKPIDPNEPRYCLCNRVNFGTMIQCDNMDNCKQEWFHLECVGLSDIPARMTKWYCPDCRRLLNIGERGEVSARGVRK